METAGVIADNPSPELRDLRIPISDANLDMRKNLQNIGIDGPVTYREASSLMGVFINPEGQSSILRTGEYLVRYDATASDRPLAGNW